MHGQFMQCDNMGKLLRRKRGYYTCRFMLENAHIQIIKICQGNLRTTNFTSLVKVLKGNLH